MNDPRSREPDAPARPEEPRTEELVERARGDPGGAFAELYGKVAPAVYGWAGLHLRGALRARLDPEDVLQEVSCRAFERFATFDPAQGEFRAWIFGIARNVLHKALRQLARPEAPAAADAWAPGVTALPDTATSITRRVARDESLQEFVDAVGEWSEEDRKLLILRGLEGLPHEEVARRLGLNTETAAKRWQRLRERLRQDPRSLALLAA